MIIWLYPNLKQATALGNAAPSASVIVPFRNEENKLVSLLQSLSVQTYSGSWDVILVNDHSTDKGVELVESFLGKVNMHNIQLIHSPKGEGGKKKAIAAGISHAKGDVIVQTDADCQMGETWLGNLVGAFEEQAEMVLGPVAMNPKAGFWSKFAALEFMSLQATGAAFIMGGKPIMGSAANMSYIKSTFSRVNSGGENLSSGDDVFIIQALAKQGPNKVKFVLDKSAQTYTDAPSNFAEFISQRARWGSKTRAYTSKLAIAVAGLIGGISILLSALSILAFWDIFYLEIFVAILLAKGIADYLLLRKYARLTNQVGLLNLFVPSAIIYPFYICITGIAMLFKTRWKGRAIQK